jgi:tetratricopeptide (TPR) repeat protein
MDADSVLPRRSPLLFRALILVLVLAVFATGVLLVRAIFFQPRTPRTAAEKAIFDAELAVRKDPRDAKARADLGVAYAMAGNYNKGVTELNTSLRLNPKLANTYYVLGIVHRLRGDLGDAAKYLERAVAFEEQFSDFYSKTYYELGKVYFSQKKYRKAVTAFEEARSNAPMAGDILFDLGRAYEKIGEKESAIDAYWRGLQYDSQDKSGVAALKRLGATEALRDLGIKFEETKESKK